MRVYCAESFMSVVVPQASGITRNIMNFVKLISILAAVGVLASCTSRNTTFNDEIRSLDSTDWHIHGVHVTVPESLTTTEVNIFQPDVDIVWHGDPQGDRRAQVGEILREGLEKAAESLFPENKHRAVIIEATLLQFHSLTPRARAITGGVHKVKFSIQAIDQLSGNVLAGPTVIEADEFAFGGRNAVSSDAEGQTMKIRITNRIAEVVADWLGLAEAEDEVVRVRILSIGR